MDDKVNEILDRLPPKPPRSRLDPHAALIEELRRRGRTYREIARVLAEACEVKTSASNIYYFVQLRTREARQAKRAESSPSGSRKIDSMQATVAGTASQGNQPTDVAQRIAAVKNRKSPDPPPIGFAYDPAEPLRLIDPGKRKKGQ